MSKPKRVLMVAGKMDFGGLETMLMNFFRHIDRDKVVFDFMLNYNEPGAYDNEILSLGGKIFIMPRLYLKNIFIYTIEVNKFFKAHHNEYDIVHGNLTSAGIIYLTLAKLWGVKTTIIHAHTTNVKKHFKGYIERLMIFPLRFCADYYFACSDAAARFCFGAGIINKRNYKLIKNGVSSKSFAFNTKIREEKRNELGITDKFVICNIGRFEPEKNHTLLLRVFNDLQKKEGNAVLLLIGDGSLREDILLKIVELKLTDKVILLKNRTDISEIMQAIDVFVLPSLHEGLPVVSIEAQASGLKCFLSDTITREADITGLCRFLPLNNHEVWVNELLKARDYTRETTTELIHNAGYDITAEALWLQGFYLGEITL